MNFQEKVAVITGAASGIGRGLAERCALEKMFIVFWQSQYILVLWLLL